MIFKNPFRKKPEPTPAPQPAKANWDEPFLSKLPYDGRLKKQPVFQIYQYIDAKPIAPIIFVKNGVSGISSHLYRFTDLLLKDAINRFHAVPAVRIYFGEPFFKKFGVWYNRPEEYLQFTGLDEEDEDELRFTKELALYLSVIMREWLTQSGVIISWRMDGIQYITEEKARSTNKWKVDWELRICWVPD